MCATVVSDHSAAVSGVINIHSRSQAVNWSIHCNRLSSSVRDAWMHLSEFLCFRWNVSVVCTNDSLLPTLCDDVSVSELTMLSRYCSGNFRCQFRGNNAAVKRCSARSLTRLGCRIVSYTSVQTRSGCVSMLVWRIHVHPLLCCCCCCWCRRRYYERPMGCGNLHTMFTVIPLIWILSATHCNSHWACLMSLYLCVLYAVRLWWHRSAIIFVCVARRFAALSCSVNTQRYSSCVDSQFENCMIRTNVVTRR